jgi:hypothetical protein
MTWESLRIISRISGTIREPLNLISEVLGIISESLNLISEISGIISETSGTTPEIAATISQWMPLKHPPYRSVIAQRDAPNPFKASRSIYVSGALRPQEHR